MPSIAPFASWSPLDNNLRNGIGRGDGTTKVWSPGGAGSWVVALRFMHYETYALDEFWAPIKEKGVSWWRQDGSNYGAGTGGIINAVLVRCDPANSYLPMLVQALTNAPANLVAREIITNPQARYDETISRVGGWAAGSDGPQLQIVRARTPSGAKAQIQAGVVYALCFFNTHTQPGLNYFSINCTAIREYPWPARTPGITGWGLPQGGAGGDRYKAPNTYLNTDPEKQGAIGGLSPMDLNLWSPNGGSSWVAGPDAGYYSNGSDPARAVRVPWYAIIRDGEPVNGKPLRHVYNGHYDNSGTSSSKTRVYTVSPGAGGVPIESLGGVFYVGANPGTITVTVRRNGSTVGTKSVTINDTTGGHQIATVTGSTLTPLDGDTITITSTGDVPETTGGDANEQIVGNGVTPKLFTVPEYNAIEVTPFSRTAVDPPVQDPGPAGDLEMFGINWNLRDGGTGSPGVAGWSAGNVIDNGDGTVTLHIEGQVGCEMDSTQTGWGYGTFECTVNLDPADFTPATVFGGLFLYDDGPSPGHNEVDVCETSKWGGSVLRVDNTYFTAAHPQTGPGISVYPAGQTVSTPAKAGDQTFTLKWEPGRYTWNWYNGADTTAPLVQTATATQDIPVPATERACFNLWAFDGDAGTVDVIVKNFSFTPLGVVQPTRLTVQAPALTFSGVEGQAVPAAKTITVVNDGGSDGELTFSMALSGTNADAFTLTVTDDTAPGAATIRPLSLPAGTYTATLTTSFDNGQADDVRTVTWVVAAVPSGGGSETDWTTAVQAILDVCSTEARSWWRAGEATGDLADQEAYTTLTATGTVQRAAASLLPRDTDGAVKMTSGALTGAADVYFFFGNRSFIVGGLIRPDRIDAGVNHAIALKTNAADDDTERGWQYWLEGPSGAHPAGRVAFARIGDPGGYEVASGAGVTVGEVALVVARYHGPSQQLTVSVQGIDGPAATSLGSIPITSAPLQFGGDYQLTRPFVGAMDELFIGIDWDASVDDDAMSQLISDLQASRTAITDPPAGDDDPPAMPTGLTVTPGDKQLAAAWTANTDTDLDHYRVYVYDLTVVAAPAAAPVAPAMSTFGIPTVGAISASQTAPLRLITTTQTALTITGLVNLTPYGVQVSAVDHAGQESQITAVVAGTPQVATAPGGGDPGTGGPGPGGGEQPAPDEPPVLREIPTWTFALADQTGKEVSDLTVPVLLTWTDAQATTAQFTLEHDDAAARAFYEVLANGIPQLRGYQDGVLRFSGTWQPMQEQSDDQQSNATVLFADPLKRLDTRTVQAPLAFTQTDAGEIARQLIIQTANRATLNLRLGAIEPTVPRDVSYDRAANIGDALRDLANATGGFDMIVVPLDPTMSAGMLGELQIVASRGTDKSQALVFQQGKDTIDDVLGTGRTWQLPVNSVTVTGPQGAAGNTLYGFAEDAGSIGRYGLYEGTGSATDIADQAGLDAKAAELLRPDPVQTITMTPDLDSAPWPFADYDIGDRVGVLVDQDAMQAEAVMPVLSFAIQTDDAGKELSHAVTFGDQLVPKLTDVFRDLRKRLAALER